MNDDDKKLGWKLYQALQTYHRFHLPLDEDDKYDIHGLMEKVYDYFELEKKEEDPPQTPPKKKENDEVPRTSEWNRITPEEAELKEYEIWSEGHSAQGSDSKAMLMGKEKGRSFADACHRLMCKQFLEERNQMDKDLEYYDPDRWDYEPDDLTYWGCQLYDNEEDARKGFG